MSKILEKLHKPPSDITKYDNEGYTKNPLLKFRISDMKKRRHYAFLKRNATEEKIKISRYRNDDFEPLLPIHETAYIRQLHESASKMPIPKMQQKVELKIKDSVPRRLRNMYPDIVKEYISEVKGEYDKILKSFSLDKIMFHPSGEADPPETILPAKIDFTFKHLGRTTNYKSFVQNRTKLAKELYITQPFVRAILNYSELDFPDILNNYGCYNNKDRQKVPLTLAKFSQLSEKDLQCNSHFIKHSWYPKIINIIKKHYKRKSLTITQWNRALLCIKGLINRQINSLKIRTLDHLIEVILNRSKIPLFKLNIVCFENINLEPSFYSIVKCFTDILRDISKVATNLDAIELQVDRFAFPSHIDKLPVSINQTYLDEAVDKLKDALEVSYTPILDYLEEFQKKYFELYNAQTRNDLAKFLDEPRTFLEYFQKIESFNSYISMLRSEVLREYFDIAILDKSMAIAELRRIADSLIKMITKEIVVQHMQDQKDICKAFENIREKAVEVPRTTEELIAAGEYMAHVKTKLIAELHGRIQTSLKFGANLFELTELSQAHIALQRTTINWLENIKTVFEQNTALQESYKLQFEEHLQEVAKKLNDSIMQMVPSMSTINDMSDTDKFRDYYILLQNFIDQLKTFDDYLEWINKEEKLFKFPKSQFPTLEILKDFVIPFANLMQLCIQWLRYYYVWMDGPFEYLKPTFVQRTTDDFYNEFVKTQKYYRNRIKQDLMGNPICKFRGQTEDPDPEKHPVPLRLCGKMIQWINGFRTGVFIVNIMCNPALRRRHWEEMSEVLGFDITPHAGTTLRKIINFKIDDKLSNLEIISVGANKELQLQGNLTAMTDEWSSIEFKVEVHKEANVTILSSLDDVQTLLDDQIIKTLSMRGSAFVKPSEKEVRFWYEKLLRINKTFEEWQKVQSTFLYLLPIFSSKDIIAQMQKESDLFQQVGIIYQRYMAVIMGNPKVMDTAPSVGLLEDVLEANRLLDRIMNGVNEYLEKKRVSLPRFFFLSNDEMLMILSEISNPLRVQPHLKKCFEGIEHLDFDEDQNIVAMNSAVLEKVPFLTKVSTKSAGGSVEKWLIGVEREMLVAIRNEINRSYREYSEDKRMEWILTRPQMVALCVSQIYWAAKVHDILQKNDVTEMKKYRDELSQDLKDIVDLTRSKDITNLNRITIKSLIVTDVHSKDTMEELLESKLSSETDFRWLSQLRYYWQDGHVLVRIINATNDYAYEYLGNFDRLVITPLTDRCYRTLIAAYQLHLNGAPEGPAGTGKTETTKDLAKALAIQCKVFNCSEGLDYKSLGKFFKGLASCGAWVCFDEFNRIDLEVLSVVAQQIHSIIQAVRGTLSNILFEGTVINVNPACYVCITMNPGYAGRAELPDNLKVLFRSVAMIVPDFAMIGETTLYSYGFTNARCLAMKIVTTYRLCSEQLSFQHHYDYGMRAVKSVLSACGIMKKLYPDENEQFLLLQALREVNLPKFLSFDIPLFDGILSDVFPNLQIPKSENSSLVQLLDVVCKELKLQAEDCFLSKVLQAYEMMNARHGFMMVGDPMTGKSTTLNVLAKVLERLQGIKVHFAVVNPKSMTIDQLYGSFDRITYVWADGVIPIIFRQFATDTSQDLKWLIFDGPIDSIWVENMNTVLDDNKKLCMTSGEMITMGPGMSVIFETKDLAQASPATVSRCGMIYFESCTLGWESLAKSWLERCDQRWAGEGRNAIMNLLRWIIPAASQFIRKNCHQYLKAGDVSVVRTTLDIFEMLLHDAIEENLDEYNRYLSAWFQAALIYSVSWGLGGMLDGESREKFDVFLRSLWSGQNSDFITPQSIGRIEVSMPSEGLVIDYMYMFKQKGSWKFWPDLVKRSEPEESALGTQIATIDTGRYMYLLEMHIKYGRKVLFVGPTGTGKSFYMQHMLMNKLPIEKYTPAFMSLTVKTTAKQAQETLLSKLVKRRKGNYGPQKDKLAIIFVDDMNMPEKDPYGAQPPLELLRQFFDYKHCYDLNECAKIIISDVLVFAACGIPGGSRQDVSPRFLSHFNTFSINHFSEETVHKIFSTILFTGFKKGGHANDVLNYANQIVSATQEIYRSICGGLKPTPAKSHYIFNVRDISRVCTGCSLLRKESVDSKKIFARLWYHECLRVFHDRLVNEVDQFWIFNKMNSTIGEHFNENMESIFENYCEEGSQMTLYKANQIMFGSYVDDGLDAEERRYEEIASMEVFSKIAYKKLNEYNAKRKYKMDIILFTYALQHLNKICRIISIQGESGLLVGIAGTGRQSLTKLAASICGETLYQPKITKSYGINDWHTDLKEALKEAGGIGKDTVFLVTETQIKMERFLQDIDCLLNQGEVPNIYAIDERQEILEMVRLAAQGGNRNADITPLQVFSYFVNRCKQKLHIILCFSPIGTALRTRIRLYPSLVNCCTIDWFQAWPEDALQVVAERYIDEVDIEHSAKEATVVASRHIHITANTIISEFFQETARNVYTTPTTYLALLRLFQTLVKKKQKEIMTSKMRYLGGLETLQKATVAVAVMQMELSALQPKLVTMAANSKKMMVEINKETIAAEAAAEQVKKDELTANAQATAAQGLKDECEKDLAQAIPVLEDAIQALNTLKPADITLVKSMKNPPSAIKLVMAAVCVIKGVSPDRINDPTTGKKTNDYWGPSKRILGDMGFLQSLKDFDKDNITPEIMKRIRKDFIPHKDFQPHIVLKASSAAEGLCKWIIAMDLYDAVAKIVAPKKTRLQAAEKEYADTMKILNEKREMAEALEKKVMQLNEELERANAEMKRTSDEVEFCKRRLLRAETLISSLGGEKSRWSATAENLQTQYNNIPGDILLSSAIIAYLSTLNSNFRDKCIQNWFQKCRTLQIPCTEDFNFVTVLGSETLIQSWNLDDLPRDAFSVENAIIMANSNRCNLFIDPQGQASKWIKNIERLNRLQVVKFTQPDYMKIIESCIVVGRPVLIENILEDLEVPIEPIIMHRTFIQGGTEYISLENNIVKLSPKFKMYLTSNLRNPHYLPEIFNKVTIINFALTPKGLEDQLLGIVVAKERPELQELRQMLITQKAKNKSLLKNAEDRILETLSSSKIDILENEEAIRILDDSKILAADIKIKQETSKETEMKIESFRLSYKPVASHSSVLYYSITDLPNIDPMYQFSLNWYTNLYIYSIEHANKSKDLTRRRQFLMTAITLNLYNTVCRSIFEQHRLLFSFVLTTKIMIATKQLSESHLEFLLSRKVSNKTTPNPDESWITKTMWSSIMKLEEVPELSGFTASLASNLQQWKVFYDSPEPHLESLPVPWEEKTSRFEKILILQAFRPDKVYLGITNFVSSEMGEQYVTPPQFDLLKSYEDSNCISPLIFILSPGSDPMGSLLLFAEKMGFDETFQSISLGQGQGPIAEKLISDARFQGSWICLQNCHLAPSWMPTLQRIWESMDVFNTASTFRLWLTSYPCETFPDILLQSGVKITIESPTGLQQNLLRSYNSEPMSDDKFYTGCPQKDRAFTRLLYGICFFHAVVQERRKFGPLGWNVPYGFNESDFQISAQQLLMFLNQYDDIPYTAISYLTAECNYGGRVTDTLDRQTIKTILADYINEDVASNLRYKFGEDDLYTLPRKSEHREMVRYIQENIPARPSPEIYGLHSNAGIMRELDTSDKILDSMILTMGTVAIESVADAENTLSSTITEILSSLPEAFDIVQAKRKYPLDYNELLNTVLVQEMDRYLKLMEIIHKTCVEVLDAIEGTTAMTPELEDVIAMINLKKVPKRWIANSYESLKPLGSYVQDLVKRVKWIHEWYDDGKPSTFWISGLFFARGFLTAIIQNFSRKFKIPIDNVTFDFRVLNVDSMETHPEEGVYINGPYIEGARWDCVENRLDEQFPKILVGKMPCIHFLPIVFGELHKNGRYKCPLYKTAERRGTVTTTGHSTNYVLSVLLETAKPRQHWIKRSVALVCQTSD